MKNGLIEDGGNKEWYLNGKYHRVDGPAIIGADGSKFWHLNGESHRVDGPAVELADGSKEWWVDGIEYTSKKEYAKAIADYKFEQEDKLI